MATKKCTEFRFILKKRKLFYHTLDLLPQPLQNLDEEDHKVEATEPPRSTTPQAGTPRCRKRLNMVATSKTITNIMNSTKTSRSTQSKSRSGGHHTWKPRRGKWHSRWCQPASQPPRRMKRSSTAMVATNISEKYLKNERCSLMPSERWHKCEQASEEATSLSKVT